MLIMGSNQSSASLNRLQSNVAHEESAPERPWISSINVNHMPRQNSSSSTSRNDATEGSSDISVMANRKRSSIFPFKDRGTLVVVKEAEVVDLTQDPTLLRLNSIPFFSPVIHNRDKLSWSREGESLRQKLDYGSCSRIGSLVEGHLRMEGIGVAKAQNNLSLQVKEVDQNMKKMVKAYTDRQKAFATHAESLNRMNEFAHALCRCQAILNESRRLSQVLNNLLPETERLEPFVWMEEDLELVPMDQAQGVSSSSVTS